VVEYAEAMLTDLVEIRRRSEEHTEEDLRFRRLLKARHHPEGPFRILAREVEKQIDCTECANCCREVYVSLSAGEIEVLAEYLELEVDEVIRQYTTRDPSDRSSTIIRHVNGGCVFLDGDLCMVYMARPTACREFPYLSSTKRSLGNRMPSLFRRASYCPIVFNTLEEYKKLLGYESH
jgi:Fe-S-cluster containining protein